jgi:hypothetical protein
VKKACVLPIILSLAPLGLCADDSDNSSFFHDQVISRLPLPDCEHPVPSQRVSLRHQEGSGVGFREGYSTLQGLFSTPFRSQLHAFSDLRAHIFNDGKWAANVGLGMRKMIDPIKAIAGVNVFYDYRQAPHSVRFHQIGPGMELLFAKWDVRLNAYFTVSKKSRLYSNNFIFSGNEAVLFDKYEQAMQGVDLRVGREAFRSRYVDLHAEVGGYFFSGPMGKNATGGLLRVALRVTPFFTLEGQASYDRLFKGNVWGAIAFNIPFGGKIKLKVKELPCSSKFRLEERIGEKVERFEIIVADKHQKTAVAIDPATGLPLHFIFVDNVRGSSDGSIEHPYATLLEAQDNSVPGDIIYVFPGDGTSKGMNEGIILQDNQTFIGAATSLAVNTPFGPQVIPPQAATMPVISNVNVGGSTVTATNTSGVTIEGFQISGVNIGIEGSNSTNLAISQNNFIGSFTTGIVGTDSTNLAISQNNFIGSFTTGIIGTDSTNLSVTQNDFSGSLTDGILAGGSMGITISGNSFSTPISTAMDISGSSNSTIIQNSISSALDFGIVTTAASGNLTISNNFIDVQNGIGISRDDVTVPSNPVLNAAIDNNQIVASGNNIDAISILTNGVQGSIDISGNTIQLGGTGSDGCFLINEGTSTLDISINNNNISSLTPVSTNGNVGIFYDNADNTFINFTMQGNVIADMGGQGYLHTTFFGVPGFNSTFYAVIENNQLSNVAAGSSGGPVINLGGMQMELSSTTTGITLSGNSSFTGTSDLVGYYIAPTPSNLNIHFLCSPASLVGLAAMNTGSTDGPDVPGLKSGSIQTTVPNIINYDLPFKFMCDCPP